MPFKWRALKTPYLKCKKKLLCTSMANGLLEVQSNPFNKPLNEKCFILFYLFIYFLFQFGLAEPPADTGCFYSM